MMPWFVWKNKNSLQDFGIWVSKFPKRVKAEERHDEVEIPGRAGTVIMLEGDDVYAPYSTEMVVTARNEIPIDRVLEWLRGSGNLILSTERDKARAAHIVGEVDFERVGNSLQQATIPFLFQPFRVSTHPEQDICKTTASEGSITNPGDVASLPVVSITGSGNNTVTIAGNAMTFTGISGTIIVDCDAQIITKDNAIWTGSFTGDFWKLAKGKNTITQTGEMEISIAPHWRWF